LRSARLEVPQLRAASIDLDTRWDALQASRELVAELGHSAAEAEVTLRQHGRFVPRLRRTSLIFEAKAPRGTYVITGGLGGLGLEIAKSLGADGADGIALLGRSSPGAATTAVIAELEGRGVRVTTHRVDVADPAALEAVLTDVERKLGPIRGVVHAAGVLDDAALMRMDLEKLNRVLAPKLSGAWNLHQLTLRRELDQFVLFSSASSLLGNSGQANYAAANAFLDALAEHRRGVGLPALAINWGAWRDVGMLARVGDVSRALERRGLVGMSTNEAVAAFRQALGSSSDRLAIMRLTADQWLAENPLALREFMAELATPEDGRRAPKRLREEALKRTPTEAFEFVQEQLTRMLGQVTRLETKQLEPHVPFDKFGLDSLMGVEFKNRIDAAFELELSVSALWSFPRLDGLSRHVVELLGIELSARDGRGAEKVDAAALQRIADLLPVTDSAELS
jgi:myxalamid-type polyketide synthase MxaE and MxaD